jgi:phytoene dehydrogenase-like protein
MDAGHDQIETSDDARFDVAVLGAGFGGIGAALELARAGRRVVLLEKMSYPGGCAATFQHRKRSYEAGATLSAGLGRDQLFGGWIEQYELPIVLRPLDPVVRFRGPDFHFEVPAQRAAFIERLAARPGADARALERFFRLQGRVADQLWPLLSDADLLPPFGLGAARRHLGQLPGYLRLLPLVGKSLAAVLRRCGLEEDRDLRLLIDAVCQITLQVSAEEVEAPFALATLDYFFRGTAHVDGGLGALAEGLLRAYRSEGGDYRAACGVRALRRAGERWCVETRKGPIFARRIVSNLGPALTERLLDEEEGAKSSGASLQGMDEAVRTGWGAVMLYLDVDPRGLESGDTPQHFELVSRRDEALIEGNHIFCSLGGPGDRPASDPWRPVTVSTHLRMSEFLAGDDDARRRRIESVQARMRETLEERAPDLAAAVERSMTASPRTFQRFTGRPDGFVGGVPRRRGWSAYRLFAAPEVAPGLRLVGDATFPGQSILATALGGVKAARLIHREL